MPLINVLFSYTKRLYSRRGETRGSTGVEKDVLGLKLIAC